MSRDGRYVWPLDVTPLEPLTVQQIELGGVTYRMPETVCHACNSWSSECRCVEPRRRFAFVRRLFGRS